MDKLNPLLAAIFKVNEDELINELTMDDVALWDSLKHMELITTIEDKMGIELSADDIMSMTSIKTIRDIVSQKSIAHV